MNGKLQLMIPTKNARPLEVYPEVPSGGTNVAKTSEAELCGDR